MKPRGLKETTIAMALMNPCAFFFIEGQPPEIRWALFVVFTLIMFFSYWVLWKYWNGANWARILVLLTSVLALLNVTAFANSNLHQKIVIAAEGVFGLFLLYWLNTALVKRYFYSSNLPKSVSSKSKKFIVAGIVIVGVLLFIIIGARTQRSVEITTLGTADGGQKLLATASLFGVRVSEGEIRPDGLYQGKFRSWHFNGHLRQEGLFEEGFWNGEWKLFDQSGKLVAIREWDHGKLIKLVRVEGEALLEVPEDQWKYYEAPSQTHAERVSR